jgi:hypothetical protein
MPDNEVRFTVDEEGNVKDHEPELKFKRSEELRQSLARLTSPKEALKHIPPETLDKIERRWKYKQGKYAAKAGVGLIACGLLSLEASKTTNLLWSSLWGLLAIILFIVGGLYFIEGCIDHWTGEP